MEKRTEIVLSQTDYTEDINDLLNLKVDDEFYFSLRGTTPRSEKMYKELNQNGMLIDNFVIGDDLIDGTIEKINEKCKNNHIHLLKVVSITKSYHKDYSFSITSPKETYVETILCDIL
jgi:hypothetical protein